MYFEKIVGQRKLKLPICGSVFSRKDSSVDLGSSFFVCFVLFSMEEIEDGVCDLEFIVAVTS